MAERDDEGVLRDGGGKSSESIVTSLVGRAAAAATFVGILGTREMFGWRTDCGRTPPSSNDASGWWSGSLELLDSEISSLDSEVLAQKL